MPLALVQRQANLVTTANVASFTGTFSPTPTQGNLLICCACSDITLTMTSTGWSLATSAVNNCGVYQWWKIAGASESTSVTVTPTNGSDSVSMMLEEWSNNTASPFDKSVPQAAQALTTNPVTGTTAVTSQADELAIGCIGVNPAGATTTSYSAWTNSFVEVNDAESTGSATQSSLGVAEKALSSTGAQSTSPTATLSSQSYSGLIATYKAVVVAAAVPPGRFPMGV